MLYVYPDINNAPILDATRGLLHAITNSLMTMKDILKCEWKENEIRIDFNTGVDVEGEDIELSIDDKNILDDLVANVKYEDDEQKYLKIYDFIQDGKYKNIYTVPVDFDYCLLNLYKRETITKGDLVKVEFFGAYDDEIGMYSIPVVKEDREYTIINGVYKSRSMTITWFYNDETESHYKKTKEKVYNPIQGMALIGTKRKNIINSVKYNLIGYLIMTGEAADDAAAQIIAKSYLNDINEDILLYVGGSEQPLIDNITNDNIHSFLNNVVTQVGGLTIRQLILNEIIY